MIRNDLYIEHLKEISLIAGNLDNVLDKIMCLDCETMEESEIRHAIYKASEKLNDAKRIIIYFSKPTKDGYLRENSSGKFEIKYKDGTTSYPLSCGSSLEIYLKNDRPDVEREEGWYSGRVEYSDEYYFYGPGNPKIYSGMIARQRVGE
ncbi:DUF5348 domain-containing protein [Clostridium sp.]|uniref:DUF5348 domain-containing protein n=1 Tax=Clostridium sp. TaxID=1506 RepID=UPI003D6CD0AC